MLPDPDIPHDAIAPNAARLMREIADAKKIRKFHQAEISRLLRFEEASQVNRWWKGARRIGDENRDRLAETFPDFAAKIDAAIRGDKRLHKLRTRRRATDGGALTLDDRLRELEAKIGDPERLRSVAQLLTLLIQQDDPAEAAAFARGVLAAHFGLGGSSATPLPTPNIGPGDTGS